MKVKSWKSGSAGEPTFPSSFKVTKNAVLQVTDIKTNRNKYYAIELHEAGSKFRVFTHYGRTDDLDSNPNAGVRESRYCGSQSEAEGVYGSIYSQKTSTRKGYKEVNLASSKIGSQQSVGKSSGVVDEKTLKKMSDADKGVRSKKTSKVAPITISQPIQEIVAYFYSEATNALTTTVNATITANGIETPLGVLTMGQIDKGQEVLDKFAQLFGTKKPSRDKMTDLSGEFYTVIPHRFGRSRANAELAVIDTANKVNEKQDTLQLMRDMLSVNGKTNVLVNPEIQKKYDALGCTIEQSSTGDYNRIKSFVEKSSHAKVSNVWVIKRKDEHEAFTKSIKNNHKELFHGSAPKNWVGILSRGLLLPKIVVSLGVKRTDAGWLGNGIYFGDVASTSLAYAGTGKRGTSFLTVATVAMGKMKPFKKITYGLSKPPDGFDSCHGVSGTEFSDDEFVIYAHEQQKLEFLVECKGSRW